ncbi:hypothetical protein C8Q73DRAFT_665251 [Cubamyces lactineus]|nr:hypothetical protein C8Q73DRAFT_665251 [Cubamyces lactineus]
MGGSNNDTVILDDRDPRIQYSAGWGLNQSSSAFDGTLHRAVEQGLSASLTFTGYILLKHSFVGMSVIVTGCVGEASVYGIALATYAVDGQGYDPTNNDALASSFSTLSCGVTLFASPTLPFGQHTLKVTVDSNSPNTLWIDSFQYNSANITGSIQPSQYAVSSPYCIAPALHSWDLSSATTQGSSGPATSASVPSPSGTSLPGPTVTDFVSGNSQNTGAIIGGSIAAAVVVILLAIFAAVLFLRRRQSRRESTVGLIGGRPSTRFTGTSTMGLTSGTVTSATSLPMSTSSHPVTVTTTSGPGATSGMPSLHSRMASMPSLDSGPRPMVQPSQPDGGAVPAPGMHSREASTDTTGGAASFGTSASPPYTRKDRTAEPSAGTVMRNVTTPEAIDEAASSIAGHSRPPSYAPRLDQ